MPKEKLLSVGGISEIGLLELGAGQTDALRQDQMCPNILPFFGPAVTDGTICPLIEYYWDNQT